MSRLCRFTELPNDTEVFVNPALVEYVKPAPGNTGAHLYFSKEHLVWVSDSAAKATKALESALAAPS